MSTFIRDFMEGDAAVMRRRHPAFRYTVVTREEAERLRAKGVPAESFATHRDVLGPRSEPSRNDN